MSDNQGRESRDFSRYDSMKTEELEELLRLDTDAPEGAEPDVELMLYVLEVLNKRNRIKEVVGDSTQEAYESFMQDYFPEDIQIEKPSARKPLRWVRRLTAAAAAVLVFVMLGTVTANAFGVNIWRAVAVWAQETLHFQMGDEVDTEDPEPTSNLEYKSLEEMIYKIEKVSGLVPTWIPDGFVLSELITDETPIQKNYIAVYENGDKYLKITIRSHQGAYPEQIEQGEGDSKVEVIDGVEYFYFTNYDQNRVAWINCSYECYISGDVTVEQLEEMVNSI